MFGTYISFQFLVTQYLQTLAGWSALSTALAFLPAGVMVVVLSTRMAALLGRYGPAPLTALAFSCLVIAYAVFLRAGVRPDYPAVMLRATLLLGLAFGLGFSSLSVAATAGVPDAEQGLAASLFQTSFQVGGAIVLAIVTTVIDAGGAGRLASAPATLAAYRPALVLITGIAAIGALVALSGLRNPRAVPDRAATGRAVARRGWRGGSRADAQARCPSSRGCRSSRRDRSRERNRWGGPGRHAERWAEMMITSDLPRRLARPGRPLPAGAGGPAGARTVLVQLTCHRGKRRRRGVRQLRAVSCISSS